MNAPHDQHEREAVEVAKSYLTAMRLWEERAVASHDFGLPRDDPAGEAARRIFKTELTEIHHQFCEPSEWTDHLTVSSPSWFDVDIVSVEKKTRNRFVVHVHHRTLPYQMQLEVRRIGGNWRVIMMWQTIPGTGKRYKCFF